MAAGVGVIPEAPPMPPWKPRTSDATFPRASRGWGGQRPHLLGVRRPLRGALGAVRRLLGLLLLPHLLQAHARGCGSGEEGVELRWVPGRSPGVEVEEHGGAAASRRCPASPQPSLTPKLLPVVSGLFIQEGGLLDGVFEGLHVLGSKQGSDGGLGVLRHSSGLREVPGRAEELTNVSIFEGRARRGPF